MLKLLCFMIVVVLPVPILCLYATRTPTSSPTQIFQAGDKLWNFPFNFNSSSGCWSGDAHQGKTLTVVDPSLGTATTNTLVIQNWNFSLPENAIIQGISFIMITGVYGGGPMAVDNTIQILSKNQTVGMTPPNTTPYSSTITRVCTAICVTLFRCIRKAAMIHCGTYHGHPPTSLRYKRKLILVLQERFWSSNKYQPDRRTRRRNCDIMSGNEHYLRYTQ